MKIHRFIAPVGLSGDRVTITDPELVHQINRVLHLAVGEQVLFGDGTGVEVLAELETVSKSLVEARILSRQQNTNEPEKAVTLYLSILKKDNFELAVQKAVEVGVTTIVPMLTDRTVKIGLNAARIQTIIREAAEQSGRGIIPTLGEVLTFEEAVAKHTGSTAILFDLSGTIVSNEDWQKAEALFIGPEGGFSETEVARARTQGLLIGSLGALTLRGETAAIVGTYRVVHSI
jgi:16S rRNA (uracil1498-N3)-methyltransferase